MKKLCLLTLFLSLSLMVAGCGDKGSGGDSDSSADASADGSADAGGEDAAMDGMDDGAGGGDELAGLDDIPGDNAGDIPDDPAADPAGDIPDDPASDIPDDPAADPASDIPDDPAADPAGDTPGDPGTNTPAKTAGAGNNTNRYAVGTAEYAAKKILLAAASGKMDDLQDVIGSKADGLLAEIRDGKLSPEKLATLKQQMSQVQLAKKPYTILFDRFVILRNAQGALIQFRCRREGTGYKVVTLTIQGGNKQGK
jgi:hypothetical protein